MKPAPITDQERGLLHAWRRVPCVYCKNDMALAAFDSPDGSRGFYWYCVSCQIERVTPYGMWIPQKVMQIWHRYGKVNPDGVKHRPLYSKYPCEVCGQAGFPVNIAKNLPGWPSVALCTIHYRQWQVIMGDTDSYDSQAAIATYAPEAIELETERA